MINANRPITEIIEFTELSKDIVEELSNELKNK